MKKLVFALLFIQLFTFSAILAARPENKAITEFIDSLISLQHKPGEPGGALAVIMGEKILYQKTFGMMDIEQNVEVSSTTLFDLASMAKHFTAYAVLLLEEEGIIDLDEDIRTYMPDLPEYEQRITTRNLLQHTSGIASTDWLRLIADLPLDMEWSHQDEIDLIKKYQQLNFPPNTEFIYSNGGYSILASIVESVTGEYFPDFVNSRIFGPLGMKHSLIYTGHHLSGKDIAKGYARSGSEFRFVSSVNDFSYGSGNIYSNLDDMVLWGRNLLSPVIGSKEMAQRMLTRYNTLENGDTIGYTYGLYVREHRGIKMANHSGGMPGFRSLITIFPDEDLLIVSMLNNQNIIAGNINLRIAEYLLQDQMKDPEPAAPKTALALDLKKIEGLAGEFRMEDGNTMRLVIEEDQLWIELPGNQKYRLYPESGSRYFIKEADAGISFVADAENKINVISWYQPGRVFPASRVKKTTPITLEELASYTGTFKHSVFNTAFPVVFDDGVLVIQLPEVFDTYLGMKSLNLKHIEADRFLTDHLGMVEFSRNPDGEIKGFIFPEFGRLRHARFVKD